MHRHNKENRKNANKVNENKNNEKLIEEIINKATRNIDTQTINSIAEKVVERIEEISRKNNQKKLDNMKWWKNHPLYSIGLLFIGLIALIFSFHNYLWGLDIDKELKFLYLGIIISGLYSLIGSTIFWFIQEKDKLSRM